jgi:lipopolysaccharide export system permease protein
MLLFRYITYHYLKYFILILGALVFFMVGFDYIDNAHKLPDSANLVLLYVMYIAFFGIDMLLPLSLVFAMIATKVFLIRSNALVSFYALGYSKQDVLKPFFIVSSIVVLLFISLHFTSFARADEYAQNIKSSSQYIKPTSDLFFNYDNKYIYFEKLYPIKQEATNIRIFELIDQDLKSIISSQRAYFKDDYWHIDDAIKVNAPLRVDFNSSKITIENIEEIKILHEFKPKILDQVYEGKVNFTITDAIDAIDLLSEQNVNIDKIKSALYKIFIYPFFVPWLVVMIFFFVPISSRSSNVTLFSFGAVLSTLVVWGFLFMFIELSNNKTISAEMGILMPNILLFLTSIYMLRKFNKTI